MSAEGAALDLPAPAGILTDARSRRIVRFALGTTLGSGLAYLIGFDLPFLVPILVAMLLASPAPCPSVRKGRSLLKKTGDAQSLDSVPAPPTGTLNFRRNQS